MEVKARVALVMHAKKAPAAVILGYDKSISDKCINKVLP